MTQSGKGKQPARSSGPSGKTGAETATGTAADEQATAGAPESQDRQEAGSMPTAEAVSQGAASPGPQSGIALGDEGQVTLPPAPMPQFEMARAAGADPVYPEGLEEALADEANTPVGEVEQPAVEYGTEKKVEREGEGASDAVPSQAGDSQHSSVVANE